MKLLVTFFSILQLCFFAQNKSVYSIRSKTVSDFTLTSTNDSLFNLSSNKNAKGYIVIFTCNHCPFAQLYYERLNNLNNTFKPLGVPLIAINSMDSLIYEEETLALMKEKAKANSFTFQYLWDNMQKAGQLFDATRTPQAFVIWKEGNAWRIKYKGLIDDNGEHPEKAKSYIEQAVNELLANKPVSVPFTESFGCKIFYRSPIASKSK